MKVEVTVSLGELIDKLSILEIKMKKISDIKKKAMVENEHRLLKSKLEGLNIEYQDHLDKLLEINEELWDIEDAIRVKEAKSQFDAEFIEIARSVYKTNDLRFLAKNKINHQYNSVVKEVKSYENY